MNWQDPSEKQQAPAGCGHGFGTQEVPAPCHVLGGTHPLS
jgi:hypothetical protein